MKIFETHSHYDDEAFLEDQDELLSSMLGENGTIDAIINVGASLRGCTESLRLAKQYEKIYAAIGVHPEDIANLKESDIDWLKSQATKENKIVAIGEIGLDYHYPEPSREMQQTWFRRQLELANELQLPVIIHSRDACEDTIQILKETQAGKYGGVIHCYSYSAEAAEIFLQMGFAIGIGGVVTFKNAKKLVEVAKMLPLERLLLETDCPYMAPEPHRGTRNDSTKIQFVAEKIAGLRGMSSQEIIDITNQNARSVFRIS